MKCSTILRLNADILRLLALASVPLTVREIYFVVENEMLAHNHLVCYILRLHYNNGKSCYYDYLGESA